MADILFDLQAEPSVPAAAKALTYADSADRLIKLKDEKGVISTLVQSSRNNWIRNSGFWFAQRQAPGTATTYSATAGRAISADGWGITNENASATYQRTDTSGAVESGLQGRFYGNFVKTTSTGKLFASQVLEGHDTTALRGRTVRVQFWAKQLVGATPTLRLFLVQLNASGTIDTIPATFISAFGANGTDPTLGTNLAYIAPKSASGLVADNGTINGNGVDCVLSASWQRFGAVFDVPSNCKNLVVMIGGTNQFAATNGFTLAQVSLSDGYEIRNWAPRPMQEEFDWVQRFYCKTFNIDTNPIQNNGINTGEAKGVAGKAGAVANAGFVFWRFPVPMRIAPATVTTYNPAAANAQIRDETASVDHSALAAAGTTESGTRFTSTGNASTAVGDEIGVHVSGDAEL